MPLHSSKKKHPFPTAKYRLHVLAAQLPEASSCELKDAVYFERPANARPLPAMVNVFPVGTVR